MKLSISIPIIPFMDAVGVSASLEIASTFNRGSENESSNELFRLGVPFQRRVTPATSPLSTVSILPLLDWRSREQVFISRHEEMEKLRQWADADSSISVKIIEGEGGAGKSSLAAAFCIAQQSKGWQAGFLNLNRSIDYELGNQALVVLDYPEENLAIVKEILSTFACLSIKALAKKKIRLLLLSRQSIAHWEQLFFDCRAGGVLEPESLSLGVLDMNADLAFEIFESSQVETNRMFPLSPLAEEVNRDRLRGWLSIDPSHRLPIFIVAAGVHTALNPEDAPFSMSGPEIFNALARRELSRLAKCSEDAGFNSNSFQLFNTYSVLLGRLDRKMIERIALLHKELSLNQPEHFIQQASHRGLIDKGIWATTVPDVLAAAMVVVFFRNWTGDPSLILKNAIELAPSSDALTRLERLAHDSEFTLGMSLDGKPVISTLLLHLIEQAIDLTDTSFLSLVDSLAELEPIPIFVNAFIMAREALTSWTEDKEDKARILNDLSNHYSAVDRPNEAIEAAEKAVHMRRELTASASVKSYADLGSTLNNLANRYNDIGKDREALEAAQEAVKIFRYLEGFSTSSDKRVLALSLCNLAAELSKAGLVDAAIESSNEAVNLLRELSESSSSQFSSELMGALNNLSCLFRDSEQHEKALLVIQEAVEIGKRLINEAPARHMPLYAMTLQNNALCLDIHNRRDQAIDAAKECVGIYQKLAHSNTSGSQIKIASSQITLGTILFNANRLIEAKEVYSDSIEFCRKVGVESESYARILASGLVRLGRCFSTEGDQAQAKPLFDEAELLFKRYAKKGRT